MLPGASSTDHPSLPLVVADGLLLSAAVCCVALTIRDTGGGADIVAAQRAPVIVLLLDFVISPPSIGKFSSLFTLVSAILLGFEDSYWCP